ncbi:FRG domain-containing protein [Pacificibacter maritimus]|uniref:FRG domain-containing protein n=1 Tax=Pacificibacter maritimus TaxID=762213 RepID=A0A3N4U974_9RHOB|nr:FRG domain-containing protein [Pacificibacter maritimus]RPE66348.1 FRG domain-containing protein [Pacificibacter maritimus]
MPRHITSLEGFFRKLSKITEEQPNQTFVFRGHGKKTFEARPSVLRVKNHKKNEHLLFRQLLARHPQEFITDTSTFDRLVRAQHYGIPTRLLDVTNNPLVALFFAVSSHSSDVGSVLAMRPNLSKQKYFDSDAVSILASLSLLNTAEKETIREHLMRCKSEETERRDFQDTLSTTDKECIEKFNEHEAVKKLIQFVRHEKSDFRPIIDPLDLVRTISVIPKRLHQRIEAQDGAFLVFGIDVPPSAKIANDIPYDKIAIAPTSKNRILKELALLGISEQDLFPDIERSAKAITKRYS